MLINHQFALTTSPLCSLACALLVSMVHAQIAPIELVAPKIAMLGGNLEFTIQQSGSGRRYQLQQSETMAAGSWVNVAGERVGDGGMLVIPIPQDTGAPRRFYRFVLDPPFSPGQMVFIPGGTFQMGNSLSASGDGNSDELPVHSVTVNSFYLQNTEVTKAQWDAVRDWSAAAGMGYDLPVGYGRAANHPAHSISWHAMVKWCNARSQMENLTPCYTVGGVTYKTGSSTPDCNWGANGYRLPTEAEWERAARGGLSGKRFPWGDTITHSLANYFSSIRHAYDVSPTRSYHPTYYDGVSPYTYTSPVGSFPANGYGLHDMAGNLKEWCWDWYGSSYYSTSPGTDPRGPSSGSDRVWQGGSWDYFAFDCRVADRSYFTPSSTHVNVGFRPARSSVP